MNKSARSIAVGAILVLGLVGSCSSPSSAATTPATSPDIVVGGPAVALGAAGDPAPAVEAGWTRYEAESGVLSAEAKADAQSFYSAGAAAGGFGTHPLLSAVLDDWSNVGFVKMSLPGLTAGTYKMRLVYNGDDNKIILVRVNGGTAVQVDLPQLAGGVWNQLFRKDLTVQLKGGTNSLWISCTVKKDGVVYSGAPWEGWANFDSVDLQKQ